MARITAPLMSLDAQGTIKKSIIYQKRKGTNVAYWNKKHQDNPNDTEKDQRFNFELAKDNWNLLTDQEKEVYNELVRTGKYGNKTGYNQYLKEKIKGYINNPKQLINEDFIAHNTQNWRQGDIADNGNVMSSSIYGGRIYILENGEWTEERPVGDQNKGWNIITMAEDLSVMMAGEASGRLYVKRNGIWAEERPAGDQNKNYYKGDISNDGAVLVTCGYPGRIFMYKNGSWSDQQVGGATDNWFPNVQISADGQKGITIKSPFDVYIYENGTWHAEKPYTYVATGWWDCAISGNGKIFGAIDGNFDVYIRENGKWYKLEVPLDGEQFYGSIGLSYDGKKIVLGNWTRNIAYYNGQRWIKLEDDTMAQSENQRSRISLLGDKLIVSSNGGWLYTYR